MAQKPLTMEQLKQIVQLKTDGVSIREIAKRVGVSRNSVRKYLLLLKDTELSQDSELAAAAYVNDQQELEQERLKHLHHHFSSNSAELNKTGVTRQLLHQEYLLEHPDGYSYSRYCYHLGQYFKNRDLSMHLHYEAGDMIMIDFAGKKLSYTDPFKLLHLLTRQTLVGHHAGTLGHHDRNLQYAGTKYFCLQKILSIQSRHATLITEILC